MRQAGQHLDIKMRPWPGPLPARAVFGGAGTGGAIVRILACLFFTPPTLRRFLQRAIGRCPVDPLPLLG